MSIPSRMVARYSLSCPWRCAVSFVASPSRMGRSPVAIGIERASVADLRDAQHAAQVSDDLERGDAGPLVGEQETVRTIGPDGGRARRSSALTAGGERLPDRAQDDGLRVGQAPRPDQAGRVRVASAAEAGRRCGPRRPLPWPAGSPSPRPAARGRGPPPWRCARSAGSSRTPRPPAGLARPPASGRSRARPSCPSASVSIPWRICPRRRSPRQLARLVDGRGHVRGLDPGLHQPRGDAERLRGGVRVAEGSRVGDDRGVEVHRDVGA